MTVDNGGTGLGGFHGGCGDLLGGDGNKVALGGGVAGAGEGAGNDDVVVHGAVPCDVGVGVFAGMPAPTGSM
ncbi:hypothetical protein D3C71_1904740 [compost metagenome]